ncbi:MAG: COG3496 family uncharacterized protein [Idiomarinaceae bacterium HL-53]|nr:MAG: COG3496 family uncharacterized protein [Idiomarinaceae bacterium HL-53]CUS48900.1 hypothetical protein Ga0003345_1881 [Idiomarinaceae bacterium HL-53]
MSERSALYWGMVRHRRMVPRPHHFQYQLVQWAFDLKRLEYLNGISKWLSTSEQKWAPFQFRSTDYLRGYYQPENESLHDAVLRKMSELAKQSISGRVVFLGNIRNWGFYFSPINCFFTQDESGEFTHMLAEVSNTPWNERHYYLVPLPVNETTQKEFHVSPFNPIDMTYHWRISPPQTRCLVHISAVREQVEFDATVTLRRSELNPKNISHVLRRQPLFFFKTIFGIYWQAMKLLFKRMPIYAHPRTRK